MKKLTYMESSEVYINGEKIFIVKYRDKENDRIYCYDIDTLEPIHFNGGIGEEIEGVFYDER